jgi:two-component system copper resistance phosphate regulon response regulator CusR
MRILLVEDYDPLRLAIAQRLREEEYQVDDTAEGEKALSLCRENDYALVLLDLTLPDLDGMEILRDLRLRGSDTSVLIITGRDSVPDRVRGLDAGSDDYVVKPCSLDELMARVRTLIRRRYGQHHSIIQIEDLEIDTRKRSARRGGETMDLTNREFALLELLALRQGGVVTRREVWEQLYDLNYEASSNVVDVYIAHLRKKIERADRPKLIHTRRGQGYVLGLPARWLASSALLAAAL